MARRPSSKKKIDDEIEDLNLVPIMNLVMCLIPIVLFGASFIQLGVVNVNSKFGIGKSDEVPDPDKKPLNLTVAIGEKGFYLSASSVIPGITAPEGAAVPEGEAPPPVSEEPTIPKNGDDYNYVELYNKMVQVKEMFPEENIVNLTADPKTRYEFVIMTMDSIRLRLEQDRYSDLADFQRAKAQLENNAQKLLWPDVVLAVAQ